MNRKIYLTTGEFARLCNVKKDTLFHYDRIGVLKPEYAGENNYRYYSIEQYDVLNVILILRELGMPLREIKEYMEERSPQKLLLLLDMQQKKIEERLKLYKHFKKTLKEKSSDIRKALISGEGSVEEEYNKEEYLILSEPLVSCEDEDFARCTASLFKKAEDADMYYDVTLGGIRLVEDMHKKEYMKYTHMYFRVPKNTAGIVRKEAGRYLTAYHHGGFDTVGKTYESVLNYADEHNLKLGKEFYEDVILDALGASSYEDYILKIAVRAD